MTTTVLEKPRMTARDIERAGEAWRCRYVAGLPLKEVADRLECSPRTVQRLVRRAEEQARVELETEPPLSIISREATRLLGIALDALRDAERCKSDRERTAHRNCAVRALKARADLLVSVGIMPAEPTKIYSAVAHLKPQDPGGDKPGYERSEEDVREECLKLMRTYEPIGDRKDA
jgi:DNA-binding Lrp family transcriptional regulator